MKPKPRKQRRATSRNPVFVVKSILVWHAKTEMPMVMAHVMPNAHSTYAGDEYIYIYVYVC